MIYDIKKHKHYVGCNATQCKQLPSAKGFLTLLECHRPWWGSLYPGRKHISRWSRGVRSLFGISSHLPLLPEPLSTSWPPLENYINVSDSFVSLITQIIPKPLQEFWTLSSVWIYCERGHNLNIWDGWVSQGRVLIQCRAIVLSPFIVITFRKIHFLVFLPFHKSDHVFLQ